MAELVEGTWLEIKRTLTGSEGSNPSFSANKDNNFLNESLDDTFLVFQAFVFYITVFLQISWLLQQNEIKIALNRFKTKGFGLFVFVRKL